MRITEGRGLRRGMRGSQRCAWLARCRRMFGASISVDKQHQCADTWRWPHHHLPTISSTCLPYQPSKVLPMDCLSSHAYTSCCRGWCARTLDQHAILSMALRQLREIVCSSFSCLTVPFTKRVEVQERSTLNLAMAAVYTRL